MLWVPTAYVLCRMTKTIFRSSDIHLISSTDNVRVLYQGPSYFDTVVKLSFDELILLSDVNETSFNAMFIVLPDSE